MRVKFFASLREITKAKEVEVDAPDIESLLDKLVQMYGKQFKNAIFDNGKIRKFFKILHNGRDIDFEQGLKTRLESGDVVAIFPPVGGG
ncbi:MAG: ubiquitin-like small modifier protein 1 [Candidatus Jordarchaeaceae archaeon]